jgi:hypothetical protein
VPKKNKNNLLNKKNLLKMLFELVYRNVFGTDRKTNKIYLLQPPIPNATLNPVQN